jgi:hypothetical protein
VRGIERRMIERGGVFDRSHNLGDVEAPVEKGRFLIRRGKFLVE